MATGPNAYDEVPYDNLAFAQTHPDRLATTARMFGLEPPPIATARVLELGCASGGNLIPMAFNLPHAAFVGVDLSRRQIERGRETINAVGIANATLRHDSILNVTREWGEFDYIICHGVFSWVEPDVQDAILRIATENLEPSGVAYISYNTYPGWHMREMVRDMMRYHAGRFDEPKEQIEQARALLDFLASAAGNGGLYGQLLSREIGRISCASDSYLFHEHLEQTNSPIYFHHFIERAERAGLQYLSEVDVSDMLASTFAAPVSETLDRISPDILHLEQYMDFVKNRQFRQTLLCHSRQKPKRALTPAFLNELMVSSRAVADTVPVDFTRDRVVVFRHGKQSTNASLPATKAAFTTLTEAWPRAIGVGELSTTALERAAPFLAGAPPDQARRAMLGDLFGAVMCGIVRLHTVPPRCINIASEKPRAHPLAAYQGSHGNVVVTAHHDVIQFGPFALEVLKLSNGQRSRGDIVDVLLECHSAGALVIEEEGERITLPDHARAVLVDKVEEALASLARNGVLVE